VAAIVLWCLTAAVMAALVIFGRSIRGPENYADAYPVSFAGFLGCISMAAGLVLTGVGSFGNFHTVLDIFLWVLMFVAAAALAYVGFCRLVRKKPYFLFHAVVCFYFALRMVTLYRRWNADPCLPDYFFYLMGHLAVTLTAYHHAAFDASMGNHRALWIWSLAGVYLCCTALFRCEDLLLMAACALWCFTNLTELTIRRRRVRPAMKLEEQDP